MTTIRHLTMKAKHRAMVRYTSFLFISQPSIPHSSLSTCPKHVLGNKGRRTCQIKVKQLILLQSHMEETQTMWQLPSLSNYINPSKKKEYYRRMGWFRRFQRNIFVKCVPIMKKYEHSSSQRSHLMALTRQSNYFYYNFMLIKFF